LTGAAAADLSQGDDLAEGHSVRYGAIDRRWELVTRRLADLGHRVRALAASS